MHLITQMIRSKMSRSFSNDSIAAYVNCPEPAQLRPTPMTSAPEEKVSSSRWTRVILGGFPSETCYANVLVPFPEVLLHYLGIFILCSLNIFSAYLYFLALALSAPDIVYGPT